jgi:hypothetical protein
VPSNNLFIKKKPLPIPLATFWNPLATFWNVAAPLLVATTTMVNSENKNAGYVVGGKIH